MKRVEKIIIRIQATAAAAIIVGVLCTPVFAVDPAPVQPQDPNIDYALSEGTNKTTIAESNDYFYVDYGPTFRVSFAKSLRAYKNKIIAVQVRLSAFVYSPTALHIEPKITVHDPNFPADPSHLLTIAFKPGAEAVHYCNQPTGQCVVSGTWWLDTSGSRPADVDHAELPFSTLLKNTPINIDVVVDTDGEMADGNISILAEVKKK